MVTSTNNNTSTHLLHYFVQAVFPVPLNLAHCVYVLGLVRCPVTVVV